MPAGANPVSEQRVHDRVAACRVPILDKLAHGQKPTPGSQTGRQGSAPEGGPITLTGIAAAGGG